MQTLVREKVVMIDRSIAEVKNLVLRACQRARLPEGIDEDAAWAVSWLESRGFPGLKIASTALSQAAIGETIKLSEHGLFRGPGIMDQLIEVHHKEPSLTAQWSAEVENAISLLPYAVELSRRGLAALIEWKSPQTDSRAIGICAGGSLRLRYTSIEALLVSQSTKTRLSVSSAPIPVEGVGPSAHAIDAWELDRRAENAMMNGVSVPEGSWNAMMDLADGVLKPKAELSIVKQA